MRQLTLLRRPRPWKKGRPGRPPRNGKKAGVSHLRREVLKRKFPVHVSLKVRPEVWNLRSRRCFRQLEQAFFFGRDRFGFRLNHFSVQGNHLHFICEAEDETALARGVQGLTIRMARALNRVMGRSGKVFLDRYHSRILRTLGETRNAVRYVLDNYRKHRKEFGNNPPPLPADFLDRFSSAAAPQCTLPPRTWLLSQASPP
jgi:hypothetical protein